MNLIKEAINYLLDGSQLQGWPEGAELMKSKSAAPPAHWYLPVTVCHAVGGTQQQAIPAVAAIAALHTSIVLVDDLLDNDGRFEKMQFRKGDIANLAAALSGAGLNAILRSSIEKEKQLLILASLNDMFISTAVGQQWDTHSIVSDENQYWTITRQKSSAFFQSAFFSGAVIGGAQPEIAHALAAVGSIYGEMIQIHDDLKDCLTSPASQDWTAGNPSLPILFALSVNHPDRDAFIDLRLKIQDPQALEHAQTILFRCGAVSYCTQHLLQRYEKAMALLERIALPDQEPIKEVLRKTIKPVEKMYEKIGAPIPADHFTR